MPLLPHRALEQLFRRLVTVALGCLCVLAHSSTADAQLSGELGAHDPSTVLLDNGQYYYFATGNLLASRSSANLTQWSAESAAFDALPAWIPAAVPGYQGTSLWAPDVIKLGDLYYLYYSASVWGTKLSAIGYATSPTLDPDAANYAWTDRGLVVSSNHSSPYNAIDPSLLLDDKTGRLWMTWGSFNNGIYVKELNPANGQPLNSSPGVNVAAPGPTVEIEGASMVQRGDYYYLFANWGGCCSGVDSTYNMRVGRSTSPTGPFLDRNGVNMLSGGGTLFLDDDGRKIGPGHFSFTEESGQDKFSYHYYDGDRAGAPTFAIRNLYWTSDDWPGIASVAPNWTGAAGSNWSDVANWTNSTVPHGIGHIANFAAPSAGQYSVALPTARTVGTVNFRGAGTFTVGAGGGSTLTLSNVAGENATLNVAEGSHTIAAPIAAVGQLGVNVTPANSTLTLGGPVTGSGLSKYGNGRLLLAGTNNAFTGSIFVKYGTLTVTGSVTANSFNSVGQILGEAAALNVQGSGSLTSNGDLNIGDTGSDTTAATGTLRITDQASVVVGTGGGLYVGSGFFANTRAQGTVIQSGGTLTVNRPGDGSFIIGGRTSTLANGIYNLSGGAANANTNVFVGGRGTGTVNQSGGTFNAAQFLAIGRYSGSSGNWTISGGSLNQSNAVTWLLVGEEGAGTLTIQDSGQVNASGAIQVGYRATGMGTIHLDGGTLAARSIVRGAGSATLNFNGGTLRASASGSGFLQGLSAANVKAGGATIDTQSFDVTIAQPLLHAAALGATPDGGLFKRGAGTLRLNAASTYTGATTIDVGTLLVNNTTGSATGFGDVVVNGGGTFGGNGSASGNVIVQLGGTIAPGNSVGRLTVGSIEFSGESQFIVELSSTGGIPGVNHDQLAVTGITNLGGNLVIDLASGLAPERSDQFTILTAAALAGSFENALDGQYVNERDGQGAFRVRYDAALQAVLLTSYQSVAFLAGDFNGDGSVDASDYSTWRDNVGATAGTLINDPHFVEIGIAQYETWRTNFGATLAGDAQLDQHPVPEPGTLLPLLAVALAATILRHCNT